MSISKLPDFESLAIYEGGGAAIVLHGGPSHGRSPPSRGPSRTLRLLATYCAGPVAYTRSRPRCSRVHRQALRLRNQLEPRPWQDAHEQSASPNTVRFQTD